jgi:prophage antirepressor-like protein
MSKISNLESTVTLHKKIPLQNKSLSTLACLSLDQKSMFDELEMYGDIDSEIYIPWSSIEEIFKKYGAKEDVKSTYTVSFTTDVDYAELYVQNIFIETKNKAYKQVKVFTERGFYVFLSRTRLRIGKLFNDMVYVILKRLRISGSVSREDVFADYRNLVTESAVKIKELEAKEQKLLATLSENEMHINNYKRRIKELYGSNIVELYRNRLKHIEAGHKFYKFHLFIKPIVYEYVLNMPDSKIEKIDIDLTFDLQSITTNEVMSSSERYAFVVSNTTAPSKSKIVGTIKVSSNPATKTKRIKQKDTEDDKDPTGYFYITPINLTITTPDGREDKKDDEEKKLTVKDRSSTVDCLYEFIKNYCSVEVLIHGSQKLIITDYSSLTDCIEKFNYFNIDKNIIN